MKRLVISVITALVIVPAGCETALNNDIDDDPFPYVYDYGEAVPTEAGIYRSSQAALEGIVEMGETWNNGVEVAMREVDVIMAGKELEAALRRLYQQALYED